MTPRSAGGGPALISVLFDLAIAERHAETVTLWRALHAAEARLAATPGAAEVAKARKLAGFVPVAAAAASEPALLDRFSGRDVKDPELAGRWRAETRRRAGGSGAAARLARRAAVSDLFSRGGRA